VQAINESLKPGGCWTKKRFDFGSPRRTSKLKSWINTRIAAHYWKYSTAAMNTCGALHKASKSTEARKYRHTTAAAFFFEDAGTSYTAAVFAIGRSW
jgi:hypothetical protein